MKNMRAQAKGGKQSKRDKFGKLLLMHRFKLELHTCFSKMLAIENLINKILEQLNQAICAQKLLSILLLRKLRYVI